MVLIGDHSVSLSLPSSATESIAQTHKEESCEGEGKNSSQLCGGGCLWEGSEQDRIGAVIRSGLEISRGLKPPARVEHCRTEDQQVEGAETYCW